MSSTSNWISVDTCLPEAGKWVLVFRGNEFPVSIARINRKSNRWYLSGSTIPYRGFKIRFWAPLPELPECESNSNEQRKQKSCSC